MLDQRAAAGSDRKPLDVFLLCDIGANPHGRSAQRKTRAAYGQPADLLGSRHVTLEQCRRKIADRHVVEAKARRIARQERCGIDLQLQQIANRIAIFGAIESTECVCAARIGSAGGKPVESCFQRFQCGSMNHFIGLPRALRRHLVSAKLADDLFPRFPVIAQRLRVQRVESEPAGFRLAVMTRQAVGVDDCAVRLARGSLGRGGNV